MINVMDKNVHRRIKKNKDGYIWIEAYINKTRPMGEMQEI